MAFYGPFSGQQLEPMKKTFAIERITLNTRSYINNVPRQMAKIDSISASYCRSSVIWTLTILLLSTQSSYVYLTAIPFSADTVM